jgi:hypothetical protein
VVAAQHRPLDDGLGRRSNGNALKSWKVEHEPAQVGKRPDEGGRRVAQVEHEATTGAVIHDDVPGCATMDEFSQER